jgi:NAD(P)-dependent dehydrogenase (short-subunit alcohol dehydrogenase family)
MRFQNKVALITGGTSGIGRATVELFVSEGAHVSFTGRRNALGLELAAKTGALYIPADHQRAEACARSVEETLAAFGRIDILFNNAGIVLFGTAEETSEPGWEAAFRLNVTAVWRMSKLVLPMMRAQGSGAIINNASSWGVVGGPAAVAYCATKGAVVQLTRAMALDHAREKIRINAVCPGDTFVERWAEAGYSRALGSVEKTVANMAEAIPMGRVGDVKEIARAVLFLASEDSSFITGTTLLVDGGSTAQ